MTALAGEWKQDQTGWWYQNDEGGYAKSGWKTIDGKSYYFNENGYMLANTTTPDGYLVGVDGAWVQDSTTTSAVPQLSTVTSVPSTVISAGTYKVGTEIAPGEYVLMVTSQFGGYYSIKSDSTGGFGSIISNGNFNYNAIITVKDGQYLELSRCTLSPISEMPQIDYTKGTMFKVGYHIPAGEYKLKSTSKYSGYFCVRSSLGGTLQDIVTNNNFEGQAYITVKDGQYLELSRSTIIQ